MKKTTRDIVKETIREYKQRHNLTYQEMANQFGIDRVTLWCWEKGEYGKSTEILIPLIISRLTQSANE